MRNLTKKQKRKNWQRCCAGLLLFVLLCLAGHAAFAANAAECFPLQTNAWRVSDRYGWRKDPFTGQQTFHSGIDLACAEGTAVAAVQDAVVTVSKHSATYGNYLRLLHPDGSETLYAHLQYLYVRVGEIVRAGQVIGTAGSTGRATGAHLHFELRRKGAACDPAETLGLADAS